MKPQRLEQVGDYLTLHAASKQLDIPLTTLEYRLRRESMQAYLLGHTRLLKISDLEKLRTVEQENAPKL